jgi:hypothetical protein
MMSDKKHFFQLKQNASEMNYRAIGNLLQKSRDVAKETLSLKTDNEPANLKNL